MIRTVDWADGKVRLIDQTALPQRFEVIELSDYRQVADAIRDMKVRGAPAIGVAAALGVALGAQSIEAANWAQFHAQIRRIADHIRATRPTAVNLFWGIDRMLLIAEESRNMTVREIKEALVAQAIRMLKEDEEVNRKIGEHGAKLIPQVANVLTHCNAGALATVGHGTALGIIRTAAAAGKNLHVYADETRPRLQGMKLTAWELMQDGIPVTIIADNMAGMLMARGDISCCIVGADRIAANGDTANKVGTYSLSVLAKAHGVPFYVAAPFSTVDIAARNGSAIPIEERPAEEMTHIDGVRIAPEGARVINPAFDVTPASNITAIVTEEGVIRPPFEGKLIAQSPKYGSTKH